MILLRAAVGTARDTNTASPRGKEKSEEGGTPLDSRLLRQGTIVDVVHGGHIVGFPHLDLVLDGVDSVVIFGNVIVVEGVDVTWKHPSMAIDVDVTGDAQLLPVHRCSSMAISDGGRRGVPLLLLHGHPSIVISADVRIHP